jgi:Tfp pilus assembly protein PilF
MKSNKLWWMLVALGLALPLASCPQKPTHCRNAQYVQVMKEQAINFYNKGDYISALRSIKDAEACRSRDPEVFYWEGLIYFKREKTTEAIEALQRSLSIDPKYMESRLALGLIYVSQERWDDAIAEFQVVAEDDYFTRPWEAYNNLGWAYMQKGDIDRAREAINKSIHLNPNFCPSYSNLGEIYAKEGQSKKAIESYQKATSLCPDNYARPHFLMALEYGKLNYLQQACGELAAAARIKGAPEAESAVEYMHLYNCPDTYLPGR